MRLNAIVLSAGLLATACITSAQTQPAGPSADEMLDRMLKPNAPSQPIQPGPAATPASQAPAAVAPDAPKPTVMREGSYVVDRVGRLTPSADGQQMEFSFESDGRTLQDPPIVVLPSLKLMDMEWARETKGPETMFRITGMVTEYKGRNYVLLDKVVVVPGQ
jgi:hypothetical protein